MIYEIKTTRKATVLETISTEIEADTLEDALNEAYELATIDPDEQVVARRWSVQEREYKEITDIDSSLEEVLG